MNTQQTVINHLATWATTYPESKAILAVGKEASSYSDLWQLCNYVRSQLVRDGIRRAHFVGVYSRDRDVMATLILAVGSIATAVPLALEEGGEVPRSSDGPIEFSSLIVDEPGSSWLSDHGYRQEVPQYLAIPDKSFAGIFTLRSLSNQAVSDHVDVQEVQADDAFVLLETSGTTGDPKVVPVSHTSICVASLRICQGLELTASDVGLNALRLDHSAGVNEIVRAVVSGAAMMFVRFDAERFVDTVIENDISWFNLVPTMHEAILPGAERRRARLAECKLRIARTGAGVMPEQLKDRLESAYMVPVIDGYGATECGSIALDPGPGLRRPGSVGQVHDIENVAIRGDDNEPIANLQTGGIWVTGPTVFPGYLDDAKENATVLVDRWYNTGDRGYLDDYGFLYLVGRTKESINRGGESIAPGEIERVLSSIHGVAASAAFGVPHATLGEDIWAAVTLSGGCALTPNQLRLIASRSLPFRKTPKQIVIIDKLPVNRSGKISRTLLRDMFAGVNPPEHTIASPPLD